MAVSKAFASRDASRAPRRSFAAAVVGLIFVGSSTASSAFAQTAGDASKGEVVFNKCASCHSLKAGETRVGPSLYGLIGRKSGTLPGYDYTEAMKASNFVWGPKTLDTYLTAPRKVVVGTKMLFAGLPTPDDRSNVIAYLAKATK